ncbi:MAG: glycosyltransferase [Actinomycetota bacterium]|nr:MAG: hypothetical protein FD171_494 [Actinomycetota bacterium]MDO8950808.1 glycosyltransferase [Actinomycetota bacterium]MDP3629936.1 glycosyltransferase [Actinomycetota bacterium]
MARLTVVIPTYNRPTYLAECLASLAAQMFRDFDLVVLDNASTEEYAPVLAEYAALDIEYIRNPENIGAARNIEKAREIGARSEFHVVFHDDDLMHPWMLELQVAALNAHPEMAWVATECQPFSQGTPSSFGEWSDSSKDLEVYGAPDELVRPLLENASLNFGSVMFRSALGASIHMRVQEFEIVSDRVLLCDIAGRAPVGFIRRPLVLYRHHEEQDSHNPIFREAHALALMTYYRRLLPEPLSAADRTLITRHATNYVLHARSTVRPDNRIPLSQLTREARAQHLFKWTAIDGQGVAALAHIAGIGRAFDAIRPMLGRMKRAASGK